MTDTRSSAATETPMLPCPFCGNYPTFRHIGGSRPFVSMACKTDNCPATPKVSGETGAEVIEGWNTRSGSNAQGGVYAKAAAESLGWIEIAKELPDLDDVVVCTDGIARWLDMRTVHFPNMKWQGHTPTHWHPIADLPAHTRPERGAPISSAPADSAPSRRLPE